MTARGLPGSDKTRWVQTWQIRLTGHGLTARRISLDDVRADLSPRHQPAVEVKRRPWDQRICARHSPHTAIITICSGAMALSVASRVKDRRYPGFASKFMGAFGVARVCVIAQSGWISGYGWTSRTQAPPEWCGRTDQARHVPPASGEPGGGGKGSGGPGRDARCPHRRGAGRVGSATRRAWPPHVVDGFGARGSGGAASAVGLVHKRRARPCRGGPSTLQPLARIWFGRRLVRWAPFHTPIERKELTCEGTWALQHRPPPGLVSVCCHTRSRPNGWQ